MKERYLLSLRSPCRTQALCQRPSFRDSAPSPVLRTMKSSTHYYYNSYSHTHSNCYNHYHQNYYTVQKLTITLLIAFRGPPGNGNRNYSFSESSKLTVIVIASFPVIGFISFRSKKGPRFEKPLKNLFTALEKPSTCKGPKEHLNALAKPFRRLVNSSVREGWPIH